MALPLSRSRGVRFAAILALLLAASPLRAGEDNRAQIEQIRKRIDALQETHARTLVAEQANAGDKADTALAIGAIYEMGMMGGADPVRAAEFYRQAATLGSAEANCALGNLYTNGAESGSGRIERDFARARSFYEKAAASGSARAMYELGVIYADGRGVDADAKKALPYFMESASRGEADALERLEPVMRKAREWEASHPGRKANFPTRKEDIVKQELVKEAQKRNAALDRTASHTYVELNRRVAAAAKTE